MAEVIDLLSSPVQEAPSHATRRRTPSSAGELPGGRAGAFSQASEVAESDSLPSITRLKHGSRRSPRLAREHRSPAAKDKGAKSQIDQRNDDFLFLSDDFETTGDLAVGGTGKIPSPTASRVSIGGGPRPTARTFSAKTTQASSREALRPAGLKRWNSIAEPIERASSPPKDLSGDMDTFAGSLARDSTRLSNARVSRSSQSVDPFASSPPPTREDPLPSTFGRRQEVMPKTSQGRGLNQPASRPTRTAKVDVLVIDSSPIAEPSRDIGHRFKTAWDPISSSMPEPGRREADPFASSPLPFEKSKRGGAANRSQAQDDPFMSSPVPAQKRKVHVISLDGSDNMQSGDEEFPDIANMDAAKIRSEAARAKMHQSVKDTSTAAKKKKTSSVTNTAKGAKPRATSEEREAEKARKLEEKERKEAEKQEAKRQRTLDKEKEKALAEVNKLRTDKKVSTPEMIIDLPSSLTSVHSVQITKLLEDLEVQHENWHSPVDNVLKWRRKVNSTFNEDLGYWTPVPAHVEEEEHVMVIMTASEFVNLALGKDGPDLRDHVTRMKRHFSGNKIIYLIEELTPWMRKNRNLRNRQFVSAVRDANDDAEFETASAPPPSSQAPPPSSQAAKRRKKAPAAPAQYVDEDAIEDALLALQVEHGGSGGSGGVLIHHTNSNIETAQWVATFTQHISTIPYRRARDAAASSAGFCMESGQVRTGDGARDTYVRMLQEVTRVTAPIAYGIAAEYGSVSELVRGLEREGPLALEGCRKSANRDGAFTDRAVGQAISKRLYKIFTGRDEGSTDI